MISNKTAMISCKVLKNSEVIREHKLMRLNLKNMFQIFLILSK